MQLNNGLGREMLQAEDVFDGIISIFCGSEELIAIMDKEG